VADGLHTEFADADESPGLLLWQVTNRWQAAQRAALAPLGLTHVQFVLLATLTWLEHRAGGPLTQRELAGHAATDPMMTSQVLRVLEGMGLVERAGHPHDRRAKALRPTGAGRKLANKAVVVVERTDGEFFAALGVGVPEFTTALKTLRDRPA
jgi:DNA-binding MarR family transcriptional regulator